MTDAAARIAKFVVARLAEGTLTQTTSVAPALAFVAPAGIIPAGAARAASKLEALGYATRFTARNGALLLTVSK